MLWKLIWRNLFHNPAANVLNIKRNSTIGDLIIINSHGSVVYPESVAAAENRIPVNRLGGPGIYFVKANAMVKKFCILRWSFVVRII
jgi:hypothetical protein